SDAFPSDAHHGWKFIAFGPDGRLYVPIGAPCNVCLPLGARQWTITRLDIAGGRPEVVARGVRNSVGFDFHPETGELWFTDNGRDLLGDDQPPDELNRAIRAGEPLTPCVTRVIRACEHFGFPYCHGDGLRDPDFNKGRACDQFTAPARLL